MEPILQQPPVADPAPCPIFADDVDLDEVFRLHRALEICQLALNPKPFWGSYTKATLKPDQRRKSQQFFMNLPQEMQRQILEKARLAKNINRDDGVVQASRAPFTTADDRARILHMIVDPAMATLWTQTKVPMDRSNLDAQRGQPVNVWDLLAAQFMDYELNQYSNPTCIFNHDGSYIPIQKHSKKYCMHCDALLIIHCMQFRLLAMFI
jgi:hypothetical protein